MSQISASPRPWAIDPDERPGMEWNVHIVERDRPHMRVCFMTSGPEAEANAALIVAAVNAYDGLAQTAAVPDLLKYANHLTDCRYRGGHDCDCGLDEIRAAARSDTSTDRPVASRPDPTGLHPTACYCRTRMERSHCAYEKRGECTRGLAVSSPDRAGK